MATFFLNTRIRFYWVRPGLLEARAGFVLFCRAEAICELAPTHFRADERGWGAGMDARSLARVYSFAACESKGGCGVALRWWKGKDVTHVGRKQIGEKLNAKSNKSV
jgi:hypothetical protein